MTIFEEKKSKPSMMTRLKISGNFHYFLKKNVYRI